MGAPEFRALFDTVLCVKITVCKGPFWFHKEYEFLFTHSFIVDGEYDHLPEQAFYMVGSIEEAVEQAKTI